MSISVSLSELLSIVSARPKCASMKHILSILKQEQTNNDWVTENDWLMADHDFLLAQGLDEETARWLGDLIRSVRELHHAHSSYQKYKITCPGSAAKLVMLQMMYLDHEEMRILVLNTKNEVVENSNCYKGTVNSSVLRAAEIYRPAVVRNCPGVILCHNHPSGDPTPSPEDIEVTEQLVKAGCLLEIELVDHIIIGKNTYISLKERLHW